MKQQLVDAIRMLERAGYIDHNGHCSARRDASSFYINSGASVRGALTVDDIVTDLARPQRMVRLLQGDVGSGKTVVALLAAASLAVTPLLRRRKPTRRAPSISSCTSTPAAAPTCSRAW